MSYTVIPAGVLDSGGLVSSDAITSTTLAPSIVNAATATHITDGAAPGDAAVIVGGANAGSYIVVDVPSETAIEVYPALAAAGGASGTLEIRLNNHQLLITDEATPTCALIASAIAPLDSRLFRKVAGSYAWGGTADEMWDIYSSLFRFIDFTRTSAALTSFVLLRQILMFGYDRRAVAGTALLTNLPGGQIRHLTGSLGTMLLQLGELAGSSDLSTRYGSVLVNYSPALSSMAGNAWMHCYGSLIYSPGRQTVSLNGAVPGQQSQLYNSIVQGALLVSGSAGGGNRVINSTVGGPNNFPVALTSVTGLVDIDHMVIAEGSTSNILVVFADVILPGVLFSDAIASPYFAGFTSSISIDDSPTDVAMTTLFTPSSGSTFLKRYSFNPRFVNVNRVGASTPISGLTVTIEKVPDVHYVSVTTGSTGTWTITIAGVVITAAGDAGPIGAGTTRNNLIVAINASAAPVTATAASNNSQIGNGAGTIHIAHDVVDTPFSVVLSPPPGSGAWVLDPAPLGGSKAATAPADYQPEQVTGSPFTTDANGRIDTDGILALRSIQSELSHTNRSINIQLKIIVEGPGYETQEFFFIPSAKFEGDFPVQQARMGNLK